MIIAGLLPMLLSAQTERVAGIFSLAGKVRGMRHGYVYLDYARCDGQWHIDSCTITKKRFHFTGDINEPTLATLRVGMSFSADNDPNASSLYLEPGNIGVTVRHNHVKRMKVAAGDTQHEKDSLDNAFAHIVNSRRDIAGKLIDATESFIRAHPHSYVSAYQLSLVATIWQVDTILNLYNTLDSTIQNSFYGKTIKKIKDAIETNSPGNPAKNFIATDINGSAIQLTDFKGKAVLIDFWASWCGPCREDVPYIKNMYKLYHGKGLEIISVSCDDNIQAWKQAVEHDSTGIWHQVLGNYKNSTKAANMLPAYIKDMYAIYNIPVIVLIDKDGMIVGRYTGDDEATNKALDEKLKETMK